MLKNTFVTGDQVWVRSNNMKKAGIGIVNGVFQSGDSIWAEVGVFTSYYDWDAEQKLLDMTDHPVMQLPIYRLEHIKY